VPNDNCTTKSAADRPAIVPLEFVQGDDYSRRVRITRDISGYTLAAAIVNAETGNTVCTFALAHSTVVVNGETHSRVSLSLTETQTALLVSPPTYRWHFRWTSPSGDTRTILAGRVLARKR
jgi:hypothetical protein